MTLEPCSHFGATPPAPTRSSPRASRASSAALEDPDARVAGRGFARLRAAGIAVDVGAGEAQARRDHRGHILRVTVGRPMVTLKLALTADGYAAGDEHDPRLAITGEAANGAVQVMRSLHDAIMIGVGTARDDDPLLTVRLARRRRSSRCASSSIRGSTCRRARASPRPRANSRRWSSRRARRPRSAKRRSPPRRRNRAGRARSVGPRRSRRGVAAAGARGLTRVFSEGGPRVGVAADRARARRRGRAADGAEAFGEARPGRARPEGDRRPERSRALSRNRGRRLRDDVVAAPGAAELTHGEA